MTETAERPFPMDIAAVVQGHKDRIDGHEDLVPFAVDAFVHDKPYPVWSVIIDGGTDEVNIRDAALHAAGLVASTANADFIVFTFDSHKSDSMINPTTGKQWERGEMQRMCDDEGYCDTGNIRDNLVVCIARRSDGKLRFESIPYHFHGPENDRKLTFWDHEVIDEWSNENTKLDGHICDALRAAITAPALSETLSQLGVEYRNIPNWYLHQIIGGARVLAEQGGQLGYPGMFVNIIASEDEDGGKIIQESAERSGLGSKLVKQMDVEMPDAP